MANTPRPGSGNQSNPANRPTGQDRGEQSTLGAATQAAKEAASSASQTARDAASSVSRTAGDIAAQAGQRADSGAGTVGGGMKSLAGTIRENLPREGVAGNVSSYLANTLERGGQYLQEEGVSGMADDLVGLVRRNPIPAVLISFGVGFLLAQATSRR
jgi:hypothetical protein